MSFCQVSVAVHAYLWHKDSALTLHQQLTASVGQGYEGKGRRKKAQKQAVLHEGLRQLELAFDVSVQ